MYIMKLKIAVHVTIHDTLCIKIAYRLAVLWFGWPKLMLFVTHQKHLKASVFQVIIKLYVCDVKWLLMTVVPVLFRPQAPYADWLCITFKTT